MLKPGMAPQRRPAAPSPGLPSTLVAAPPVRPSIIPRVGGTIIPIERTVEPEVLPVHAHRLEAVKEATGFRRLDEGDAGNDYGGKCAKNKLHRVYLHAVYRL